MIVGKRKAPGKMGAAFAFLFQPQTNHWFTTTYLWPSSGWNRALLCSSRCLLRPSLVCMLTKSRIAITTLTFCIGSTRRGPHLTKNNMLFHQDNAWKHSCLFEKIKKFRYDFLPHLPYSPRSAHVTIFCFQTRANGSKESDSPELMKLPLKQNIILRNSTNFIICKLSKN